MFLKIAAKKKISIMSAVFAISFFVGITSAYANKSVSVYLNPGQTYSDSAVRYYTAGETVVWEVWNSSSSKQTVDATVYNTGNNWNSDHHYIAPGGGGHNIYSSL